ncbi:MAG: hypothetical protein Kow0022_17870 [Phycisphaerales bacterium]
MSTLQDRARKLLRRHHCGRVVASHADGVETRAEDVRFIVDGRTGRLVFPVTRVLLELGGHTLYVPDEAVPGDEDTLELVIEMKHEPPVPEELRDRHLAYHGHQRGGVWVSAAIHSGRFSGELFDGGELMEPNRLVECEPRLCRVCNESAQRLAEMCAARFGTDLTSATVVGVDGYGLDVRLSRGVHRLEFAEMVSTEEQAIAQIRATLFGRDES